MASCISPQDINMQASRLWYKHIYVCYPAVFAPPMYAHSLFISMHTCAYSTQQKQIQDVLYTLDSFVHSFLLAHNTHKCTTEAVLAWSIPLSLNDEEWPALQ